MGLFKKNQKNKDWTKDLKTVVSADPEQFLGMSRYDDSTVIVKLKDDYDIWISDNGHDLSFIVALDDIGKMAERFGLTVEEAYNEMTQYVKVCSLGIDAENNLRFASVLIEDRYSPDSLRDMMYRWTFQVEDYENAFETFVSKYQEADL